MKNVIKDIRLYKVNNKLAPNYSLKLKIKTSLNLSDEFINNLKYFSYSNDVFFVNESLKLNSLIFPDLEIFIEDNVDKSEVLNKLNTDLEKEKFEIDRCEKLLNNPNFMKKAPKEKIKLEQDKLENHKILLQQILEKIKNLG